MVDNIERIGQNAGRVWQLLNSNGHLTKAQLMEKTNLESNELSTAIGWLARENKIFNQGELFALDQTNFPDDITEDMEDRSKDEIYLEKDAIQNKESFEAGETVNKTITEYNGETTENVSTMKPNVEGTMLDGGSDILESLNETTLKKVENIEENISAMKDESDMVTTEESTNIEKTMPESTNNVANIEMRNHESGKSPLMPTKPMRPWEWVDDSMGTCDLCKREIVFEKNLSGLTVGGKFFACEECCQNTSEDELLNWTKSKMKDANDVRPIGLWTIQEKNKEKSVLFRR